MQDALGSQLQGIPPQLTCKRELDLERAALVCGKEMRLEWDASTRRCLKRAADKPVSEH